MMENVLNESDTNNDELLVLPVPLIHITITPDHLARLQALIERDERNRKNCRERTKIKSISKSIQPSKKFLSKIELKIIPEGLANKSPIDHNLDTNCCEQKK